MDFEKFRRETADAVDKELKLLLGQWRHEVGNIDSTLLPLVDKFIGSCYGGKGLRGVLAVLGYQIGKQSSVVRRQSSDIFKIAASYEIFHAAILAHDDIIDQSTLRRGQPSLYMALGGSHNGISQSICLGDAGFFLTTKIISESNFPDKDKIESLKWFSQTMLDTAIGEILDINGANAITTAKLKTARYSISGPLILGAILGGLDLVSLRIRDINEFGENSGIAFQIQDDILGVFGSAEQTGKSTTSDIEEGKNTLLYNCALKNVNPKQQKTLEKYYGKGSIGEGILSKVRQVFIDTGALKYAQNMAKEYENQALKILPRISKDKKMSKLLEQLAEYLVQRTK